MEKPKKMFSAGHPEGELEVIDPALFAKNGCLDVFTREGHHGHVKSIIEQYGNRIEDDSNMDPMEVLIRKEEEGKHG